MFVQARVVSLHIHPEKSGAEMLSVQEFNLEAENGIVQDKRYFGRRSSSGAPVKRQITLIEREQISEHAAALGCDDFPHGAVRSNIETEGIDLVPLAGKQIQIGTAILVIGSPRDPCEKMDRLAPGLRELMDHGKQGVLAQVLVSGKVRLGDSITVL
jgi:MOSC domain-containing protein YiiM